ncbi:hypothetical protein SAMN05216249_105102 [Acetitomaculum ruminis DSM 5522]|uniref:Phosphoesterase n=1 Tax=Acetitomaculum ruminis DSM 5522 TaxID=1120918 RepID=A0A1I0WZJ2_9FIRM|nr:phosphodiesterase [Acetitomaculum ruminis]SFA94149.1 hypothetical protein SAMN05216249_105102 [Acetitomaculum ruminis DSM 5522]
MKLLFASDIHGSAYYCRILKEIYEKEKAEKLVLLGDLLYHGPRNDLPKEYAPKEVFALLNSMKEEILTVRGNCEAEVDQMVLEFPCLADYMIIYDQERMLFITHGHKHNTSNMPPLKEGDILVHGHTHVPVIEEVGKNYYINPGSISIPKDNTPHSYMVYENGKFTIKDIEGNIYLEKQF